MKNTIYVNMKEMVPPHNEYVCWLDIMGTQEKMLSSIYTSGNNIFRLHAAVLRGLRKVSKAADVRAYPVMDGVYLTAKKTRAIQRLMRFVFQDLADTFVESKFIHQFLVRGAIAYGPIYHGTQVTDKVSQDLDSATLGYYKDSLLLGTPMIQAYEGEKYAPPFGLYVHESARAFCPEDGKTFSYRWWDWWRAAASSHSHNSYYRNRSFIAYFARRLKSYFSECELNSKRLNYPIEKIQAHRAVAEEYFRNVM